MYTDLLEILRCPSTGQPLEVEDAQYREGQIFSGWLVSSNRSHRYPIRNFIPRFVPESNYADNFGMQWNTFRQTQLDSCSGHPISGDRFWKATSWAKSDLAGRWLLDVGCGSGRFAEIALEAGARVVAIDYSNAADACYLNLRHFRQLHVLQANIYALPFRTHSFDFVYSLGVLQHTPDVAKAFSALPPMLALGGRLCVDFYGKSWKTMLLPKYWLRPVTKRVPRDRLFSFLERLVPRLLTLSRALARVPMIGGALKRVIPVANYDGLYPLSEAQHLEWSVLDTFDALSPAFDQPQTPSTVYQWFQQAGLADIEVLHAGHLVGRGIMRNAVRN